MQELTTVAKKLNHTEFILCTFMSQVQFHTLIFHHNLLSLLVHSSKQKVVYKHQSQYSASAELPYISMDASFIVP